MRRFRFSLEGLLKVRRLEMDEAELHLKAAQRTLQSAEEALALAERTLTESVASRRQLLDSLEDSRKLLLAAERESALEQGRQTAFRLTEEAQGEVERRADEYRRRRHAREAVEKLRAQAWDRWRAEGQREEQAAADERVLRDFAVPACSSNLSETTCTE